MQICVDIAKTVFMVGADLVPCAKLVILPAWYDGQVCVQYEVKQTQKTKKKQTERTKEKNKLKTKKVATMKR